MVDSSSGENQASGQGSSEDRDPAAAESRGALADELRRIADQGFTGTLVVDKVDTGEGVGQIWLAGGRMYLAVTPQSADLAGVVFGADVGSLADISAQLASPIGGVTDTLAEAHPTSIPALGRLLHEHNLTGLFEMMVAGPVTIAAEPGTLHPVGPRFAEAVDDLLGQAERRLDIWREIANHIPSTSTSFRLASELPGDVAERLVTADEWRYLALIGSGRTVGDLITTTGESAFRVMTSIYRLLLEGVVIADD